MRFLMRKRNDRTVRRMMTLFLTIAISAMVIGCTKKPYTGNSDADRDHYQLTSGAVRTNHVTAEMMAEADYWLEQDDSSIAAVMKKAEAGESVTIAVIGGSITQGTISAGSADASKTKSNKCYADIFAEWWTAMFPQTEINLINAGIGGTDSYLGVHRLEEDVLQYQPDLVLVEYAVNDGNSDFYQTSYDNLVRNILESESKPAVLLYFFGQSNGTTSQAKQAQVGLRYGLPMLSYINAIRQSVNCGLYTESELSGDTVHPSKLGHAIAGEILWHYLNEVYSNRDRYSKPTDFTAEAVTREKYVEATILDSKQITPNSKGSFVEASATAEFPNGWKTLSGEEGITFTTSFANLGILYLKTVDGKSGKYDILVDGEKVATIDADFSGGWGNAIEGKEVYTSDCETTHTVEIRKAESSQNAQFILLGLMTSRTK